MTDSNLDRPAAQKPFRRLLLTGAAGNLGQQLRGALAAWADVVRVTDIAPLGEVATKNTRSPTAVNCCGLDEKMTGVVLMSFTRNAAGSA